MKKLNRVIQKIENDYQEFKAAMYAEDSAEVFESAGKILTINEIYYLLTNSYEFSQEEIGTVLAFKGNILEQIYDEWLHTDCSYHDLIEDTIVKTLTLIKEGTVK